MNHYEQAGVKTVQVVPWEFVAIFLTLGALAFVISLLIRSGIVPRNFGGDRS